MNYPIHGIGAAPIHAKRIMNSYKQLIGQDLIEDLSGNDPAKALFDAPIVVLSHGMEENPVLNYGNLAALTLWEMNWEAFTQMPSRYTAEPMERDDRDRFMKAVTEQGYVNNYTGIRISSTGRRFYIMKAVVWNVTDEQGRQVGQAAAFREYKDC